MNSRNMLEFKDNFLVDKIFTVVGEQCSATTDITEYISQVLIGIRDVNQSFLVAGETTKDIVMSYKF